MISEELLLRIVGEADAHGFKLERTGDLPTWEAMPGYRHQRIARAVADSVAPGPGDGGPCGCHSVLDVYVRFADGSFRAPDVAVFCSPPPDTDGAVTEVPVAVVEIVSEGYEEKDRRAPDFYLSQGVRDVVVYDPRSREILHASAAGRVILAAPRTIELSSGCRLTIPL